ncbi:MAG TPA: hypothetical protein VGA98_07625 [Allosphingosinicella sp.]
MRYFNVTAAVAAALLIGGTAAAKEKSQQAKSQQAKSQQAESEQAQSEQAKPKKVCRTQEMPGRITPQRICRIVTPSDRAAEDSQGKADDGRGTNGRGN